MATYKTPGVYIEEIPKLPASVASVETAIPAFIGYTETARDPGGKDLKLKPTRISSLVEYQAFFGGAPSLDISDILLDGQGRVTSTDAAQGFYMYDAIRLFFANGGGDCYIISVNPYGSGASKGDFLAGLGKLAREDEPTLILFPDAVLLDAGDFHEVQQAALLQCADLQDRFCIFDLQEADGWNAGLTGFRDAIGINHLKYGAAYVPHLRVSLDRNLSYKDLKPHFSKPLGGVVDLKDYTSDAAVKAAVDQLENALADYNTIHADIAGFLAAPPAPLVGPISSIAAGFDALLKDQQDYAGGDLATARTKFKAVLAYPYDLIDRLFQKWESTSPLAGALLNDLGQILKSDLRKPATESGLWPLILLDNTGSTLSDPIQPFGAPTEFPIWTKAPYGSGGTKWTDVAPWDLTFRSNASDIDLGVLVHTSAMSSAKRIENMKAAGPMVKSVFELVNSYLTQVVALSRQRLDEAQATLAAVYPVFANLLAAVKKQLEPVPPSGAIAGIYAFVDSTRGVWKAPANVSLSAVSGLTRAIDDNEQQGLNVDVTSGKSINALRYFKGKGNLVWGARTLAGNDNEWRYVPVRRLFNMVEESIKKATEFVVFEPNDANTWARVKGMIENYLTTLWRDGALAGAKPNEAFFVRVGLGQTMTAQDILEGRLIVEIGMAAVRPAEFIILQFSHMLQTS